MKCEVHGAEPGSTRVLRNRRRARRVRVFAPVGLILLVGMVVALPRLMSSPPAPADSFVDPVGGGRLGEGPARAGGIGQEVRDGDLAFVVSSFDCDVSLPRTPQGRWCVLSFEMRNTGRVPVTFEARSQTLVDAQNRNFRADVNATAAHPANAGRDLVSLLVNPGNQVTTALVFDVPPDVMPTVAALDAAPEARTAAFVSLRPRPS